MSIGGEGFNGMRDEGRNARCRFGTLEVPAYYLLLATHQLPLNTYHLLFPTYHCFPPTTVSTYHLLFSTYHLPLTYLLEVSVLAIDANGTTLTCSPPPVDLAGARTAAV